MEHSQSSVRDWEREAAAWRVRAEQLQATVGRLRSLAAAGESAGFLAHELNNLFTPVVGYCQAASADGASDELRDKALKRALVASERVGELSRAILGLAGSADAEPDGVTWCDVAEPVAAALLVLGVERWKKEGIDVCVHVPRGTLAAAPACVVQQVVMNLMLNARRAMDGRRGAIEVECRVVGGMVRVEVRDEGKGMDVEVIERLADINNSDVSTFRENAQRSTFNVQLRGGEQDGGGRASGSSEKSARGGSGVPLPGGRGSDSLRGGAVVERGSDAQRYEVDVQELARSGSINGQARWGVRMRGGESAKLPNSKLPNEERRSGCGEQRAAKGGNGERSGGEAGVVPASSRAARKKQEKTIARLRGGKLAASASPIKVWDAGEVARELRTGDGEQSRKQKAESRNRDAVPGDGEAEVQRSTFNVQIENQETPPTSQRRGLSPARSGGHQDDVVGAYCSLGGAGLGLALCVELVTRFSGRMAAQSVAGEGTTVVVELPVAQARGKRAA